MMTFIYVAFTPFYYESSLFSLHIEHVLANMNIIVAFKYQTLYYDFCNNKAPKMSFCVCNKDVCLQISCALLHL